MRITVTSTVCALLLAGCAVQRSDVAVQPRTDQSRTQLIGMSKSDLLQCAGTPVRQERLGELEFLAFDTDAAPVSSATHANDRPCEAAFVLRSGIVQTVNYRGKPGRLLPKGERCAFIVEHCLTQ